MAGPDRITRSIRTVVSGSPDFVRTDAYAWKDGQSTGTLLSRSETSTGGLQSWQTLYPGSGLALVSHSLTAYSTGGARTVTAYAPDGSYTVSAYSYGRLVSAARYGSGGASGSHLYL